MTVLRPRTVGSRRCGRRRLLMGPAPAGSAALTSTTGQQLGPALDGAGAARTPPAAGAGVLAAGLASSSAGHPARRRGAGCAAGVLGQGDDQRRRLCAGRTSAGRCGGQGCLSVRHPDPDRTALSGQQLACALHWVLARRPAVGGRLPQRHNPTVANVRRCATVDADSRPGARGTPGVCAEW